MTNEQILKKAIEKAVKNGIPSGVLDVISEYDSNAWEKDISLNRHYGLIFLHGFAMAFWGKEYVCKECGENAEENYDDGVCKGCCEGLLSDSNGPGDMEDVPAWKYHLQQMVLEKDPIKYLEKFI